MTKLDNSRCPWCGEIMEHKSHKCEHCGEESKFSLGKSRVFWLLCCVVLCFILSRNLWWLPVVFVIVVRLIWLKNRIRNRLTKENGYRMLGITERISSDKFMSGDKFYIFSQGEKIGKGHLYGERSRHTAIKEKWPVLWRIVRLVLIVLGISASSYYVRYIKDATWLIMRVDEKVTIERESVVWDSGFLVGENPADIRMETDPFGHDYFDIMARYPGLMHMKSCNRLKGYAEHKYMILVTP